MSKLEVTPIAGRVRAVAVVSVIVLGLAACTEGEVPLASPTTAPSTTSKAAEPTTTTPSPATTTTTAPETSTTTTAPVRALEAAWPVGTMTCAELEGNFPNGVDDHQVFIDQGIVTFYDQPVGGEQTIQFMDDPTCTIESEAWKFMIGYLLDPDRLYRSGDLCDWYSQLLLFEPPPANVQTVENHLADAAQLCG